MDVWVRKGEIEEIVAWCEKVKKEKGVMFTIERNPFREKIGWMSRFPLIEVDRPRESAGKNNLVYDSTMRKLYQNLFGTWMEVVPDIREGVKGEEKE
jgi:hypothetical protein